MEIDLETRRNLNSQLAKVLSFAMVGKYTTALSYLDALEASLKSLRYRIEGQSK